MAAGTKHVWIKQEFRGIRWMKALRFTEQVSTACWLRRPPGRKHLQNAKFKQYRT